MSRMTFYAKWTLYYALTEYDSSYYAKKGEHLITFYDTKYKFILTYFLQILSTGMAGSKQYALHFLIDFTL